MQDYKDLAEMSADGWHISPTFDPRVKVGQWEARHFRTLVCDDVSGWNYTGPAYPTKTEAYANVRRVLVEWYGDES